MVGIGDDAAIVALRSSSKSRKNFSDTLSNIENQVPSLRVCHFTDSFSIAVIEHADIKSTISNSVEQLVDQHHGASSCAKWLLLNISLYQSEPAFLQTFSAALHVALEKYGIALIGGDTTRSSDAQSATAWLTMIGTVN